MLIKSADGKAQELAALKELLDRPDATPSTRMRIETEIRNIEAGARAERDAAYLMDLYFGPSQNYAVIHDLRFEVGEHAAQIDHLVINRLADVWVCESKAFAEGLSINRYGEWSRWWHGKQIGMPSPIEQNRRHIHLLEGLLDSGAVPLPRRLGFVTMKPRLRSLVLISNAARISRPGQKVDGIEQVIKAEQLKTRVMDEFDKLPARDLSRVIGKDQLERFARSLAALHRPATVDWAARFGLTGVWSGQALEEQPPVPAAVRPAEVTGRKPWLVKYEGPCASCGTTLQKGSPAVWDNAARKMFCLECRPPQRSSAT